jgi:hypothetical protein
MKLPPFGKQLIDSNRAFSPHSIVYIFTGGSAWKNGNEHFKSPDNFDNALVLPPDHLPREYHWPVKNRIVLIKDSPIVSYNFKNKMEESLYLSTVNDYLEELVYYLYKAGASGISISLANNDLILIEKDI